MAAAASTTTTGAGAASEGREEASRVDGVTRREGDGARGVDKEATRVIHFVTGNPNKLKEVQQILSSPPSTSSSLSVAAISLDLPEMQGESPAEITKAKCLAAYRVLQKPVVVEDTSLCFDALGGLPGPYIKWFLKRMGAAQLPRLLEAFPNKKAAAVCTFGFWDGSSVAEPLVFEGRVEGTIVELRGPTDFGWDPIFQPDGSSLTFAEMSKEVKNSMSHRAKALQKLKEFFSSFPSS